MTIVKNVKEKRLISILPKGIITTRNYDRLAKKKITK